MSNGIGFEEHAEIELSGIKGVWSLRDSFEDPFDTMLVQSFVGETRILGIKDEEMDEVKYSFWLQSYLQFHILFYHTFEALLHLCRYHKFYLYSYS